MTEEGIRTPEASSRSDRWSVGLLVAVFFASLLLPLNNLEQLPVLCTMRRLTGLPCPGCGMTHAFVAIAHGQWSEALHFNAMAFPLFVAGLAYLALKGWAAAGGRKVVLPARLITSMLWAYAVALFVFGVYRILVPGARPY